MERKVFFSMSLILMGAFCAFSQAARSFETIVIDNFDDAEAVEWTWKAQASRYVAEGDPKCQTFDGSPNALRVDREEGAAEPKVLGVTAAFDKKGDNWFEIYPAKSGENGEEPFEIPLKGHVSQLDVWVWGSGYRYSIAMLIRDANGSVHEMPLGRLSHIGWKNMHINIPSTMVQRSYLRTGGKSLKFVGFRIKTDATAPVDGAFVYFDNLKYLTDILVNTFDGYELENVEFGESSEGGSNSGEAQ